MLRPTFRYSGWLALIAACAANDPQLPLPRTIALGSSLESLQPVLAEDCGQTEVLHYTGEMAAPFNHQVQFNCSGLDVFGARRRVEFMFNDGPLGHVWIFLEPEELANVRRILTNAYGAVVFESSDYAVFASGTVALRREPLEVLIATPELIADLTGYPGK